RAHWSRPQRVHANEPGVPVAAGVTPGAPAPVPVAPPAAAAPVSPRARVAPDTAGIAARQAHRRSAARRARRIAAAYAGALERRTRGRPGAAARESPGVDPSRAVRLLRHAGP